MFNNKIFEIVQKRKVKENETKSDKLTSLQDSEFSKTFATFPSSD